MAISENFTFCIALIVLLSRSLWKKIRKSSEWECEDGATQKAMSNTKWREED